MTVKIGTGSSALDLKDAKVWGNQANKIMVGTGTSAVEVWSLLPSTERYLRMPFQSSLTQVISTSPVTASVLGTVTHNSEQAVFAGAGRIKVEPFINFTSNFTVSMRVRASSTGTEWKTIAQARANSTDEWWIGCTDNVNVGWRNNSGVVELWTSGQVINDGQWHHLKFSVERDPTNDARVELRVWIDGVQRGYKLSTTQPAAVAATLPIYIGGNADGPGFAGRIDDVEASSAIPYVDADYYYPLTGMSLQNNGKKSTPLTSQAGSLADRGNHAWLAKSTPRINVTESWSNGWTASAWFEQTGTHLQPNGYLFSRGSANKGTAIYICTEKSNPSRLYWRLDDGSTLLAWTSEDNILPTSGWFHFAVTAEYVSPNYKLRFFVNGNMVRSSNLTSRLNNLVFASDDWASFGNASTGDYFPYEGNIDDITMWSRKLTDGEVANIYAEGRSS